uniref:Nucleotide-diphospho-sugar transferase domain-containing protein n=1 Tax=Chromera velia CCMP2878 TaxID=1169474 RepID=A0A0G4H5R2_9ALVE|eukprot:Cvel_5720.t1-p1 / transcript=Cvel_5720.t1 / gene=Cvel_5720 / organism=Chromera_velia_CCMP2878 / gene_product=UDP-glucuronate:xylan alpha-glucuronosyltransferase, putative / transcript_product=UDP-glucuronate:xylan alpha-glucuronosyltransferase, putative / location=Cvel_scaffold271:16443-20249(-) / protein_length=710 / sequence_SO=supercontig / SO=protein_coding / is_pseudo=false
MAQRRKGTVSASFVVKFGLLVAFLTWLWALWRSYSLQSSSTTAPVESLYTDSSSEYRPAPFVSRPAGTPQFSPPSYPSSGGETGGAPVGAKSYSPPYPTSYDYFVAANHPFESCEGPKKLYESVRDRGMKLVMVHLEGDVPADCARLGSEMIFAPIKKEWLRADTDVWQWGGDRKYIILDAFWPHHLELVGRMDKVVALDSGDAFAIRDPFPHIQQGVLYVQREWRTYAGCAYMVERNAACDVLPETAEENNERILNCGLVAGYLPVIEQLFRLVVGKMLESEGRQGLDHCLKKGSDMAFTRVAVREMIKGGGITVSSSLFNGFRNNWGANMERIPMPGERGEVGEGFCYCEVEGGNNSTFLGLEGNIRAELDAGQAEQAVASMVELRQPLRCYGCARVAVLHKIGVYSEATVRCPAGAAGDDIGFDVERSLSAGRLAYILTAPDDEYLMGALVSAQSIFDTGTKAKVGVVLEESFVPRRELSEVAQKMGVELLRLAVPVPNIEYADYKDSYLKLFGPYSLGKTFDKVVMLDADILFWRNMDMLFYCKDNTATNHREQLAMAGGDMDHDWISTQMVVMVPSEEKLERIRQQAQQVSSYIGEMDCYNDVENKQAHWLPERFLRLERNCHNWNPGAEYATHWSAGAKLFWLNPHRSIMLDPTRTWSRRPYVSRFYEIFWRLELHKIVLNMDAEGENHLKGSKTSPKVSAGEC